MRIWDYVIAAIGSGLMAACSTESPKTEKARKAHNIRLSGHRYKNSPPI